MKKHRKHYKDMYKQEKFYSKYLEREIRKEKMKFVVSWVIGSFLYFLYTLFFFRLFVK